MAYPVKLFIYDLSGGMAKRFAPLFGIDFEIEGIWHTSIVVHGMEVFFGSEGIQYCKPGGTAMRSDRAQLLRVILITNGTVLVGTLSTRPATTSSLRATVAKMQTPSAVPDHASNEHLRRHACDDAREHIF